MSKIVSVYESSISINGQHIIVALGKSPEKLSNGAVLYSVEGKQWRVVDNDLKFQPTTMRMIREKEVEGIFFYDLQGIEHIQRPDIGQELTIIEP